jgi:hypothetical protein
MAEARAQQALPIITFKALGIVKSVIPVAYIPIADR